MRKLIYLILALAFSSCVSFKSCPTYAYKTKNITTGQLTTNYSDLLYHKGEIVTQIPDMTKFEILEVKLTQSHY